MYRYNATLNANSFNREEVQIINNNYKVAINSPNQTNECIQIWDLTGRLLKESKNVNQNNITVQTRSRQNPILIVFVTAVDGIKITKKLV